MPRLGAFRPTEISLRALMDNRSAADEVAPGFHRLVKNAATIGDNGADRMPGWINYGSGNDDLHDQMVPLVQGYESFSYTYDSTFTITGYTYANYAEGYSYTSYDPYNGSDTTYYPFQGDFIYTYDIDPGADYVVCGGDLEYRPYCSTNFSTNAGREAITLISEFGSGEGVRRLVAATESRIYALNEVSHSWRIIADGMSAGGACGCGRRRFHSDRLGNYMLFTNNYDDVLAYNFDAPASGCGLQSAQPIEDLVSLGIRKASVVVEYKGFIFLMNVEADGVRYVAKAIWSDYGLPTSFAPSNESLAGDSDIGDPGEAIIDAKVLGDYLVIYKERSIWRATIVDQASGLFNFMQIYHGERALRYRSTLVSTGTAHYYFGVDDIYRIDLYGQAPEPTDWITKSTRMIFDENLVFGSDNVAGGISQEDCELAVGGYDAVRQTLWFSWVGKRNADGTSVAETTRHSFVPIHSKACPNRTLTINLKYPSTSYVDHGFSAFGNFRPDDRMSLRDWLLSLGVCGADELDPEVKEGELHYTTPDEDRMGPPVNSILNATEDPSLPNDPDSLCAALGDQRFDDLCENCGTGTIFLMASAADFCIKQYDPDTYSRTHFYFSDQTYAQVGYDSILESAAMAFGTDSEKYLSRMMVEFAPPTQVPTPKLYLSFGYSSQPECERWVVLTPQDLKCQTNAATRGVRPYDKAFFNYLARGRYLFYRISLTGQTGPTTFTKAELMIRKAER